MAHDQERLKKQLVKKLEDVRMVQIACRHVGISRATYYRWRTDDPVFAEKCDEAIRMATEMISDLAESHIVAGVKNGDIGLAKYWLQHHHKDYKQPAKVQLEQKETNPYAKYRPDQMLSLLQIGTPGYQAKWNSTTRTDEDTAE